jgi:hypothetical protein
MGGRNHRADRIVQSGHVQGVRAQDDDVRTLAGTQRPDDVRHAECGRTAKRRHAQHVGGRNRPSVTLPAGQQRRAHHREHVAGHRGDDVNPEAACDAGPEHPAGQRRAVPHLGLDGRRDRHPGTGTGDKAKLVVAERVPVHEEDVLAEQPLVAKQAHGPPAGAQVDRDAQAEFTGEPPVRFYLADSRVGRSRGRQRHRDELAVAGEVAVADSPYLRGRSREDGPVAEHGADTGRQQPGDRRVAVVGRVLDGGEVLEGRDARVEALQRARQVGGAHVVGTEPRGKPAEYETDVFTEVGVDRDAAQHGLPGVTVGVHESRQDDPVGDVENHGSRRGQIRPDSGDRAVLDQHVRPRAHHDARLGVDHAATA